MVAYEAALIAIGPYSVGQDSILWTPVLYPVSTKAHLLAPCSLAFEAEAQKRTKTDNFLVTVGDES
jgi:hypothetical protein